MDSKKNCSAIATSHLVDNHLFSIDHIDRLPNYALHPHWHEEVEFLYIKSGGLTLFVDDLSFDLSEGEAFLIPPRLLHWTVPLESDICSCGRICYDTSLFFGKGYRRYVQPLINNGKAYLLKLNTSVGWQKRALRILSEMLFLYDLEHIGEWKLEIHGQILILWSTIYRNYYANIPSIQNYEKRYKTMMIAVDYIHAHYNEDVTSLLLANEVNMSIGSFCKHFKQLFGMTPNAYLNKYRIQKSRDMLTNTDMNICDISLQCGYNSLSHYNRAFQRYMRTTPSSYRKYVLSSLANKQKK